MCVYIGPKVFINNAFYARSEAQSFLEMSTLRRFHNILYDKITEKDKGYVKYKYVHFQLGVRDMEDFFETDSHFIEGIDKVICIEKVKKETVDNINSIYEPEIRQRIEEARKEFAGLELPM